MKTFGIMGWSGSGKTTLLLQLIPVLVARGIKLATIKHTHHVPTLGDDETRMLAEGGAVETVVAASDRYAVIHELHGAAEPDLGRLLARLGPVDLVLVEGFKYASHPKLEVWNGEDGKPLLAPSDPSVVAIASDIRPIDTGRPLFRRGDVGGIAEFICKCCE